MDYFVHESACVDEPCSIGAGTKIWHFSHILCGAQIGSGCVLGQNVHIAEGVVVGKHVKIQNNVSVYSGVEIHDEVFLGPSCVFTNVTNPRSEIDRRELYETIMVRRGATIGANATIVCGVTIGRYAFVGAGAVVTHDVPDYGKAVGVPARNVGWVSRYGHELVFDANNMSVCPEAQFQYKLENGVVRCLDVDENTPLPAQAVKGDKRYSEYKQVD